jgi:1-acyl-sn-glycerol-3-phosphate acyltransferase
MMRRDLRRAFRRVVWVGPPPAGRVPPGTPLAIAANHHHFYDGHLLWLLAGGSLGRTVTVWMREWDRIPLFGPIGALPFPADDAAARLATIRTTARRLRDDPAHAFLYFPEGEMGVPDAGVAPFPDGQIARLARVLPPETRWLPVAIHVTWWGEDRPTALLTAGDLAAAPPEDLRADLDGLIARLRDTRPGDPDLHVLLEGRRDPGERWNLRLLSPLFRRWI